MDETVRQYLLGKTEQERALLEDARRDVTKALERARYHAERLDAYERTLEIETAGTDAPYIRQSSAVLQFPRVEVEYRPARQKQPPAPPKPTKTGFALKVIKEKPGLTPGEIYDALPDELPFPMEKKHLYAALSKLVENKKAYHENGRYYPTEGAEKETEAVG